MSVAPQLGSILAPFAWLAGLTAVAGCGFQRGGTGAPEIDSTVVVDSEPPPLDAMDGGVAIDTALTEDSHDPADVAPDVVVTDDGTPDTSDTAPCTAKTGDFCKDISPLAGAQVIDGKDDDFCGVEQTTFDVRTGAFTDPMEAGAYVTAVARVRAAWSTTGMHFHFSVQDATYFPTPTSRPHWQGDSVELFIAGHNVLTGAYDGVIDRGAMQLIFVPPSSAGVPARAGIYYKGGTTMELPSAMWLAREVPGGYEIEVGLPWDFIGGTPPYAAGKKIGIDFAVNDVVDNGRSQFFYSVYRVVAPPAGSCGVPFCDDRVWCKPPLAK
ncbi:MAG: sugar-binding protein [Polyangiales bacterium]